MFHKHVFFPHTYLQQEGRLTHCKCIVKAYLFYQYTIMDIYNNCSYYILNDYSVTQLILDNTSFRPLSLAVSPAEHLKKNSSALIIGLDNNHALWLVPLPKKIIPSPQLTLSALFFFPLETIDWNVNCLKLGLSSTECSLDI